ncbi:MAG: hypothetical protein EPN47_00690 [Acidobacteria bacterium]|nr:MAG: hypothetical protein EPN47_00690 [Acidobacteriota bacterium]
MKILGLLIVVYTPVMLLIHVGTSKILRAWNQHPTSWISRRLPPQRALRIEGMYWLLALAAWPLWHALGWKVVVVLFALIHLGIWAAGELTAGRKKKPAFTTSPSLNQIIIVFDSVEALVLTALGVIAVLFLTRPS